MLISWRLRGKLVKCWLRLSFIDYQRMVSPQQTSEVSFSFQVQSPSFLIAFKILLCIMYVLRELTVKLQMQAIDVTYAYQ